MLNKSAQKVFPAEGLGTLRKEILCYESCRGWISQHHSPAILKQKRIQWYTFKLVCISIIQNSMFHYDLVIHVYKAFYSNLPLMHLTVTLVPSPLVFLLFPKSPLLLSALISLFYFNLRISYLYTMYFDHIYCQSTFNSSHLSPYFLSSSFFLLVFIFMHFN